MNSDGEKQMAKMELEEPDHQNLGSGAWYWQKRNRQKIKLGRSMSCVEKWH
jgi:hypothetical protein